MTLSPATPQGQEPSLANSAPVPLDPLDFPLHGSRLIEASAGTGKTFTIALLYVRLVLVGRMPPELLVVTFTEAATKELRSRIRQRLAEAAALFGEADDVGGTSQDPLWALRASFPVTHWKELAARLQLAAQWMDEAAIFTIHAWCYRMLREHAFDSGSLFTQTLLTEQNELLQRCTRDYWRSFVYPLGLEGETYLGHFADPDSLQREVSHYLPLLPLLQPAAGSDLPSSLKQIIEGAVSALAAEYEREQARLLASLDGLQARLLEDLGARHIGKGLRQADLVRWLAQARAWALAGEVGKFPLTPKAIERLSPAGLRAVYADPALAPGDDPALAAIGAIAALPDAPPDLHGRLLLHAARWIARRLAEDKARRAELSFDDLLLRLDAALHGPSGTSLATVIRRQYPVAMVDEFQDTDPLQYRIFDRIYDLESHEERTAVFLIGDPKQAIYSFRGADIHAYLQARRATRGRHYTLDTNFRSTEALVEAVNFCFVAAEERPGGAFQADAVDGVREVPFHPVRARGRTEIWTVEDDRPRPLTVWVARSEDKVTQENYVACMAKACAIEIARLLNLGLRQAAGFQQGGVLRPLVAGDIAVLVNNFREAQRVREALAEARIRSVYLSEKEVVLRTETARDVLCWLQACAMPTDERLLRAALVTATLGAQYDFLDRLQTDELAWEAEVEHFSGLRRVWKEQGILAMIHTLLHDFSIPARLLAQPGGERNLTDVLHLAEILQEQSQHLDGELALIRGFADLLDDETGAGDLRQVRLESDADLVQVVTVHKSKGLEYPLVFVPFAANVREVRRADQRGGSTLIKWHDREGRLQVASEVSDEELALADHERLGEDLRKLYVAMTRARHALWLGVAALDNLSASALGRLLGVTSMAGKKGIPLASAEDVGGTEPAPTPRSLDRALQDWESCSRIALQAPPDGAVPLFQAASGAVPEEARVATRRVRENWWIASYSAISIGGQGNAVVTMDPLASTDGAAAANLLEEAVTMAGTGDSAGFSTDPAPDRAAVTPETGVPKAGTERTCHDFPRGAGPGVFLHDLLEWAATVGFSDCLRQPSVLREAVTSRCAGQARLQPWAGMLVEWLPRLLTTPLALPQVDYGRVSLAQLQTWQAEMEFLIPSHQVRVTALDRLVTRHTLQGAARPAAQEQQMHGMLKGYIDLVFEWQGRYYVADYKSNHLGDADAAYHSAALREAILEKRYDLQYCLYLLALHRLLRSRLPDYDYDRHVGGAVYFFLRGVRGPCAGVHAERPGRVLIEALDGLFRGAPSFHEDSLPEVQP